MVLEAQAVHLVEYLVRLAAGEEAIIISACALETSLRMHVDLYTCTT